MIHILHAEMTKTLTLRSIQLTVLAAVLASPALAFASGISFDPDAATAASFPIESHGFETAGFAQPLIILMAALITGSEYIDDQLRTTLLATPRRGKVLAAKIVVVATLAASIGLISTAAAVVLKHTTLGEHGLNPDQLTAAMGWNLLTVAINYTLISLIAAAITVVARTYIVTLVVLVPLVLGLTISLLGLFPLLKYLPDLAGIQLLTSYPGIGLLTPMTGGLVMAAWATVATTAAAVLFLRRDTQ